MGVPHQSERVGPGPSSRHPPARGPTDDGDYGRRRCAATGNPKESECPATVPDLTRRAHVVPPRSRPRRSVGREGGRVRTSFAWSLPPRRLVGPANASLSKDIAVCSSLGVRCPRWSSTQPPKTRYALPVTNGSRSGRRAPWVSARNVIHRSRWARDVARAAAVDCARRAPRAVESGRLSPSTSRGRRTREERPTPSCARHTSPGRWDDRRYLPFARPSRAALPHPWGPRPARVAWSPGVDHAARRSARAAESARLEIV